MKNEYLKNLQIKKRLQLKNLRKTTKSKKKNYKIEDKSV